MATVINNPSHAPSSSEGASAAVIIGITHVVLIVLAFIVYGLPALRNQSDTGSGTNVNIPDQIDVNVNK